MIAVLAVTVPEVDTRAIFAIEEDLGFSMGVFSRVSSIVFLG